MAVDIKLDIGFGDTIHEVITLYLDNVEYITAKEMAKRLNIADVERVRAYLELCGLECGSDGRYLLQSEAE